MDSLVYEKLISDPRIKNAHQLIIEALQDHRSQLTTLRPPASQRSETYAKAIRDLGQYRGRPLALPFIGSGIGHGALVELSDGSVKYDFISGIGAHFFGHSDLRLLRASFEAMLRDTIMQGNLLQDEASLTLSRLLVSTANSCGGKLSHCFLTSSGAMANENALKIAFQKHSPANRLLAFEGCFVGRTLALSHISDRPAYRTGLPGTLSVDYIPFFDPARPEQSTIAAVQALDKYLIRYPGRYAAMIFELVLGEGGCYPGAHEFFAPLMKRLRQEDVAVIVDEIQTFGRTQRPFAFQYFKLDELVDIVTVGKMIQVCATLFRSAYNPTPELISQTFTSSTAAILAAQAIIEHLMLDGFFGDDGKIAVFERTFHEKLIQLEHRYQGILTGPYGIGAMVAFTFLDGRKQAAKELVAEMFEEGLIGFLSGNNPTRVRFLPPVAVIDSDTLNSAFTILERSIQKVSQRDNQ